MIMSKFIISIFTTLLLLNICSCNLESETYGFIGTSRFPTNEKDVKALVTANAYGVFRVSAGLFNVADGIFLVSDLMTDIGECTWRQWTPILYGRWQVDNAYLSKQYTYLRFMSGMTLTLDRIESVSLSEATKEQYVGELKCARGWLAFCMYDLFGPVPIGDLETLKDPLAEKIIPRLTEVEMRDFIETNLLEAAAVLPYSYKKGDSDYGRFTKGLANTVLLKFYMMTKQWGKAESMGRELTHPNYGYGLVPNYKDIFTLENEKNIETVWAVNCLPGYQEHRWMPHVFPNDYPTDPPHIVKWGGFKIAWSYFRTFEEKDLRKETIISAYVGTGGIEHSEEIDVPTNGRLRYGAVPLKYGIDPNTSGENSSIDWIIYRYSDVLTLLSEAITRNKGAVSQEAVDLLNQIRVRAGLLPYAVSDFEGADDLLARILTERGHEFFFEGVRRQDLIRYGRYVEAIKGKSQAAGETTLISETMERYPIPPRVIDEGKGIIVQNPGY